MYFEQKVSFIASVFRKLLTPRNMVTWMPWSSRFRTPVENQRLHGWQTMLKSARQHFHLNFPLSQDNLSKKTSLLVRCEILGHFGNMLTAAHMSACHNSEKFQRHVQTPLSQTPERFSDIFIPVLQSISKFSAFWKNRSAS